MARLFYFAFLLLFLACKEETSDPVRVVTKGIYDPVEVTVDGQALKALYDLDEFVKGGDARIVPIKIVNNSGYPVLDIQIDFLDVNVNNYDFLIDDQGKKEFPGKDGTCLREKLESGQSCTIFLQFTSLATGQFSQEVRLRYKNIVEPGDEKFKFTVYSGDPASLVFVPDGLNYHFGELTGAAQTPLVERDQRLIRSKKLIVTNAGELRARDLGHQLSQNCASKLDGTCPVQVQDAYKVVEYNCPKVLRQGEICDFTVSYENKNQGSDPVLKDVSFNSTFKISYYRDPHKSLSALNAYYKSTSANIEAYLETSLSTLEFEDPLIVGNRAKKSFRVKNTGYREGYFRRFNIYAEGDDTLLFYCQKEASAILTCYEADGDPASLEKFPLFFTDSQNCMNPSMDKDFPIDSSCIFDVHFQPSVKYLSDGAFNYDIKLDYDTRWLGQEHLTESALPMLTLRGEWKAAARLVWKDIKVGNKAIKSFESTARIDGLGAPLSLSGGQFYTIGAAGQADIPVRHFDFTNACEPQYDQESNELGTPIDFIGETSGTIKGRIYKNYPGQGAGILIDAGMGGTLDNGSMVDFSACRMVNWTDLGRLAMELWEYYEREVIQFRFKNIGGSNATNIRLFDGDGAEVLAGTPKGLGDGPNTCSDTDTRACEFYKGVSFTCGSIAPSLPTLEFTCAISFNFAPIKRKLDDDAASNDSMFDHIGSTVYENFKAFKLSYETGETYLDSNLTTLDPDFGPETIEARLHGVLVNKGLLGTYEVEVQPDNDKVAGEYNDTVLSFRNIGTGAIPYIHDVSTNFNANVQIIPTTSLPPGSLDCNDIIDWSPPSSAPATSPGSLASGQKCLITLRYETVNKDKGNPSEMYAAPFKETLRYFNRSLTGDDLWEWDTFNGFNTRFLLSYYDGDVSNEDKTGMFSNSFGNEESYDAESNGVQFKNPPHIMPYSAFPVMSAVVMRPSFTKADLWSDGSVLYSGTTIPRTWFYSDANFNLSEAQVTPTATRNADDADDALFSYRSIDRAKNVLPGLCADCDYYIHFGTFKAGGTYELEFVLENMKEGKGIVNLQMGASSSDRFVLDPGSVLTNEEMTRNNGVPIKLTFSPQPSDSGVYEGEIEYSVDTGIAIDGINEPNKVLNYKVYFVAESTTAYPELEFEYQKYQVTTYENSPPTESLEAPTFAMPSTYNLDLHANPATDAMVMEMVKRENPAADPTSGYVKRRITIRRKFQDINNLEVFIKASADSAQRTPLGGFAGLSMNNGCSGANLTSGSPECYIDFTYQPNEVSIASSFTLTFAYELAADQIITQNVLLNLIPKTPGTVTPLDALYNQTYGGVDAMNDPLAIALDFGDAIFDQDPKLVKFEDIVMTNSSPDLRASFLKAYQLQNSISDPSVYPTAGEWTDRDGRKYVTIFENYYADSSPRVTVKASEECLYGEIDPGHPSFGSYDHNERGFLGGGYQGCSIDVYLSMNSSYINKSLNNREEFEIMQDNYFKLFYYSFDRVEDSYVSFYFKGNIDPDSYKKNQDFYAVDATDMKTITFTFKDVVPDNPGVGNLAGYRIYYSDSKSALDNVLLDGGLYVPGDYSLQGGINTINLNTSHIPGISRGKAFYFKVLAIRYYAPYNEDDFPGLQPGEYLSDGDLPVLRVVVPKFSYAYVHEESAMVKKDVERESGSLVGPVSYSGAQSVCSSLSGIMISDPSSSKGLRFHKLMSWPVWEAIKNVNDYNTYAGGENHLTVPHWLDSSAGDINSIFGGFEGYSSDETSQEFASKQMYYFRCTDNCAADRQLGGGFYGQSFQDYEIWMGESVTLGHVRCAVDVSF